MAAVQPYDLPQVTPGAVGTGSFRAPSVDAFAKTGEQVSQMGDALSRTGQEQSAIVVDAQNDANRLRVMDAENQAREAALHLAYDPQEGFSNIRGGDVLHVGDNKQPLAVEYGQRYQQRLQEIGGSLTNPEQQHLFAESAGHMQATFDAEALRHESDQTHLYHQSIAEGAATLAVQEIGVAGGDTNRIDQSIERLRTALSERGRLQGLSGDEITALINTGQSGAISQAIENAMAKDDSTTASALFGRYQNQLLAPDRTRIEGPLHQQAEGAQNMAIVDQVMGATPPAPGSPAGTVPGTGVPRPTVDRAFQEVVRQESGGRAGVPGPMTRYGQAHGATQLLDGTGQQMAQRLGVEWRPDLTRGHTPEALAYQMRLGRAYFDMGLQRYGGDLRQALMFYHGGPNQAIWGPKTHQYADAIMGRLGAGGGSATPAGVAAPTMEDAVNSARQRLLETNPNATPRQVSQLEEMVQHRFEIHQHSITERENQSVRQGQIWLEQNHGDWEHMPAAIRNALPPGHYDDLRHYGDAIRAPTTRTTDLPLYAQLVTHPDQLRNMSDAQWNALIPRMSEQDFQTLSIQRGHLRNPNPDAATQPGHLDFNSINRIVDNRMTSVGINIHDPAEGRVPVIRQFVTQAVITEQQRRGRAMNDAETSQFIDGLFLRSHPYENRFLGVTTSEEPRPALASHVSDIPSDERSQIEETLRRRGAPVTDSNVLRLYLSRIAQ